MLYREKYLQLIIKQLYYWFNAIMLNRVINWNSNIKLKGNVAEQTLFAHITLMAIGKNNVAKVMLRLASPAL